MPASPMATGDFFRHAWTEANNVICFMYGMFKQNQSYQLIQKNDEGFKAIVLLQSMFLMHVFYAWKHDLHTIHTIGKPFPF
jgi:hypothetical protein